MMNDDETAVESICVKKFCDPNAMKRPNGEVYFLIEGYSRSICGDRRLIGVPRPKKLYVTFDWREVEQLCRKEIAWALGHGFVPHLK